MQQRERCQHRLAGLGDLEALASPVVRIGAGLHELRGRGALHQLDRRVVLELQDVGHVTDGRPLVAGPALDRQEQLVLRGGEPGCTRRVLGEPLEDAQRMAEASQRLVVGLRDRAGRHVALRDSGCRARWVSMSVTGRLTTSATIAAMRVTGSKGRPAISVTTRVVPSGVFVTPTQSATIIVAISRVSFVPGSAWCTSWPSVAPMKNSGMMKPPFQPEASVTVVPASLASSATARAPAARRRSSRPPSCSSPNVS